MTPERKAAVMRLALVAAAAALVAVVAGVLFVARADSGGDRPFLGSRPPLGIVAPDFALRDENGRLVRMRDLRGRVVLLTFLDTRCTDACPIIGHQLSRAYALLTPSERRRVVAVAISVNPYADTPARVRTFLRRQDAVGIVRYLTGSERELRRVWRSYYVLASLDTGDSNTHSSPLRIFDRDGVWVSTLRPELDLTPRNVVHDAREALRR